MSANCVLIEGTITDLVNNCGNLILKIVCNDEDFYVGIDERLAKRLRKDYFVKGRTIKVMGRLHSTKLVHDTRYYVEVKAEHIEFQMC